MPNLHPYRRGQQLGKCHFAGQLHDCAKQIIFVVEMTIDVVIAMPAFLATVSIEVGAYPPARNNCRAASTIAVGSRIPRTPARSSGDLAMGTILEGSCGSFGWDGNCKVEPPPSFDVVLFGPLEKEISQINMRFFVQNSPIGENSSIFRFVNCLSFSDLQVATGLHR